MRGTRITEKFIKYIGKSPSDFAEFTDKITCARVNFQSGKKRGRGLKLEEAAKKLDISAGYLCELETGKRNVPSYIIVNTRGRIQF